MYKREALEYDTDYVKKYDEDLNTTLIFVRCHHSPLQSISLIPLLFNPNRCFHRPTGRGTEKSDDASVVNLYE